MNDHLEFYDAIIVGGGPVGLMLSIGLAEQGRKVLLVERSLPEFSPSFDGRVLALTYASKRFLEQLNIWQKLEPHTTSIEHVHVSQKGYMGLTHLHAKEMNVPALGYSVTASDLGNVLWSNAEAHKSIRVLTESELVSYEQQDDKMLVQLQVQDTLFTFQSLLLVGSDGTQSKVRELMGVELQEKSYDAFGVIAKIETELNPQGWSFERFTKEGPVALLPMTENFHKAVMVLPSKKMDWVKSLNDKEFIQAFSEKMGERLGRFLSVSERVIYPLKETYALEMAKGRTVLMGNAAHTQHPVAAQGLNLGIADIQVFLEVVQENSDIGEPSGLQVYQIKQQPHHEKIMGLTDGLIHIFQNASPVIGHMRGIGLMVMEAAPALRQRFTRMGMGIRQ